MVVEQIELAVVRHIAEVERHIAEVELQIAVAELHIEEVGHHTEEAEHHTEGVERHTEEAAHRSFAVGEEQERALENQIPANLPLEQVQVPEAELERAPPAVEEDGCNFANRLGCYWRRNRPPAQERLYLGFRRDHVAEPAKHVEFLRGLA